jgi:hypothetical protein
MKRAFSFCDCGLSFKVEIQSRKCIKKRIENSIKSKISMPIMCDDDFKLFDDSN